MKRYFLVYYVATVDINSELKSLNALGTYIDVNHKYINMAKFKKQIIDFYQTQKIACFGVTITGISELSEDDFLTFVDGTHIEDQKISNNYAGTNN